MKFFSLLICLVCPLFVDGADVRLGVDCFFEGNQRAILKGKRVGLVTNHTGLNSQGEHVIDVVKRFEGEDYKLVALFGPEHGIDGYVEAGASISDSKGKYNLPVYSLHGKTRRPTEEMLKNVDVLIYDIQDVGARSYTYISTLFYVMEEAAKRRIKVIVFDRPNPINGVMVDGPMLEDKWRSFVGYVNVPYCHGMTVGELAKFFNREYKVNCDLKVIPMQGWKRSMSFKNTGLTWTPTSPNIPDPDSPYYYPMTGILGELQLVNIGIGFIPFKVVLAPWIDGKKFAQILNKQRFAGVVFEPFSFCPPKGRFKGQNCQGVKIKITDIYNYRPLDVQYLIIGILKSLYPQKFALALKKSEHRIEMFCKVTGTRKIYDIMTNNKFIVWKLKGFDQKKRSAFINKRKKYLIYKS